ncbi:hypothetical protein GOP47_0026966 [Adiantum capillus-veneris]|nr:hypothetical protein GOP47_0026966 [Adiantum capillus-veneris]
MRGRLQVPSLSHVQNGEKNYEHLEQRTREGTWKTLSVEERLHILEQGVPLSTDELVQILQKCRKERAGKNGVRCYAYLRKHGLETDIYLGNYLVPMLVDIGRIQDAQEVFDRLPYRNEHSWNSLLSGYVSCGKAQHALILYKKMQEDPLHPNGHTFIALLSACAKLADKENGAELHSEIARRGLAGDFLVGSALVHMYAKCGLLALAQEVFDGLNVKDAITWTSLIAGYVKLGHFEQALFYYDQMQMDGLSPNLLTFVCSLKACGFVGVVEKGQIMHAEIARRGLLADDVFVGNGVIDMYAKCGLVAKAQEVFNELPTRDVVSWNTLMTGYANIGNSDKAFDLLKEMQLEELSPDAVSLVCNLKACSTTRDLETGRQLHVECAVRGFSQEAPLVGNALVDMYASCGLLAEAQKVFDSLNLQDAIVWTALITGYTDYGFPKEALEGYQKMQLKDVSPDVVTYICSLKACSSLGAVHKGREIHAEIDRLQMLQKYANIGTALVDLYASCGLLTEAQEVFDGLPAKDVASWNVLMLGYLRHGFGEEVLKCFKQMQAEDVCANVSTLIYTLKACGTIMNLGKGCEIYNEIVRHKFEAVSEIGTALIEMYFSCGSISEAHFIFDKLPHQELASWNTVISGCINNGLCHEAVSYLDQMLQGPIPPDSCTYACCLKACSSIKAEAKCCNLHAEMVKKGFLSGCNSSGMQSTVLWNAVITAYLILGHGNEALDCFKHMQKDGVTWDVVTYICSLKAVGTSGAVDEGHKIHIEIVKLGLLGSDVMIDTALLDMYAAFSLLAESKDVFDRISHRDVVTWNALISGFAKHGYDSTVLDCIERMKVEGILPNALTYERILTACGNTGALKKGEIIHLQVSEERLETELIGNALVQMYAKCKAFAKAQEALRMAPAQDVSLWNALIAGCSRHSLFEEALGFYEQMHSQGVVPDAVTFVCSLKACSSTRMLGKGQDMHRVIIKRDLLRKEFLIGNKLIDLYAKCGLLEEAQKVFDTLPARNTVSWNTLIAGYIFNECGQGALTVSKQMHRECVYFDEASYLCSLKACGTTGAEDYGLVLHSEIVKKGLLEWSLSAGNALIDMYVGCRLLVEAQEVLRKLSLRDVVSWTTLIAGFLRHSCVKEAHRCLQKMQREGVPADVHMWNVLIAGYSHLGEAEKACWILERVEDVELDEDSFQGILAACSHAGLVEMGQGFLQVMEEEYGIPPNIEHFTCMVDLLGRAGQLEEALVVINRMPWQPDIVAWHTLLAASKKRGNVVVGLEAFESALKLDERDTASFVSMYNIFAGASKG